MGFAQAIAYYNKELPHSNLSSQDLYDAYAIIGNRFGNELNHYFVILDPATARNLASKRKPRFNKKQKNQNKFSEVLVKYQFTKSWSGKIDFSHYRFTNCNIYN